MRRFSDIFIEPLYFHDNSNKHKYFIRSTYACATVTYFENVILQIANSFLFIQFSVGPLIDIVIKPSLRNMRSMFFLILNNSSNIYLAI